VGFLPFSDEKWGEGVKIKPEIAKAKYLLLA
jgi:hypothetical protein